LSNIGLRIQKDGVLAKYETTGPDRFPIRSFISLQDDDARMNSVFVGDFYLTGDRAIMDDDGYIWFVGRSDDVILSSG